MLPVCLTCCGVKGESSWAVVALEQHLVLLRPDMALSPAPGCKGNNSGTKSNPSPHFLAFCFLCQMRLCHGSLRCSGKAGTLGGLLEHKVTGDMEVREPEMLRLGLWISVVLPGLRFQSRVPL